MNIQKCCKNGHVARGGVIKDRDVSVKGFVLVTRNNMDSWKQVSSLQYEVAFITTWIFCKNDHAMCYVVASRSLQVYMKFQCYLIVSSPTSFTTILFLPSVRQPHP